MKRECHNRKYEVDCRNVQTTEGIITCISSHEHVNNTAGVSDYNSKYSQFLKCRAYGILLAVIPILCSHNRCFDI